jgi:hypothetical protein
MLVLSPCARCSGRPRVGADDPAASADHARAEAWHSRVIRPAVDGKHRAMMAEPALCIFCGQEFQSGVSRIEGGRRIEYLCHA